MAMNVKQAAGEYVTFSSVVGVADNTVLYQSGDISNYNYHIIENETAISIDVFVSVDGTNYSTAAVALLLIDDVGVTGPTPTIALANDKVGIIRGKFKGMRVQQNAAGTPAAGLMRGAHGVE